MSCPSGVPISWSHLSRALRLLRPVKTLSACATYKNQVLIFVDKNALIKWLKAYLPPDANMGEKIFYLALRINEDKRVLAAAD